MQITLPNPGDIIYAKRNKHASIGVPWPEYKHFGIYIGDYQVIHFSGSKGHETDVALADIIQTSLRQFLKGDFLLIQADSEIAEYDNTLKPFPADVIIQRAKTELGKHKGDYNLFTNNCEHFANWCRYDKKFCRQIKDVPVRVLKNVCKDILSGVSEGLSQSTSLLTSPTKEILNKKEKK